MLKLPHSYTHFTCQQSNGQNSPSQASTVCELRTSRCSNQIQKRERNQRSNCQHCCIIRKAREFQKNFCVCFIDCANAFDCVDHNKLWKILKEIGISELLSCFLRNLYAGQEATLEQNMDHLTGSKLGKDQNRLYIFTLFI